MERAVFDKVIEGLADESRRPAACSHALDEEKVCRIVKLKHAHPTWGPRKIHALFARTHPEAELPSESSFKRVLSKAGWSSGVRGGSRWRRGGSRTGWRRSVRTKCGRWTSKVGTPFACSSAPLGLTRLSAWWLVLGVDLDRIAPGRPDQNGAHERMHRDIAWELEREAAELLAAQQAALDVWSRKYNEKRPHEALGMQVPAEFYERSSWK